MSNYPAAMSVANDQTLIEMISSAKRRLVYMAPGMSVPIAKALADCYQQLPQEWITVITDVDPEVCRMGYGEIAALEQLEVTSRKSGGMVHRQPGLRIGLVIADDTTMIFAPTPQLIEASPETNQVKPNAIRIGLPPADLERDLGLGPDGVTSRTIGLDKASLATIRQAQADLQANPPQRFDISRRVRVFNAQFEFVEFELKGAAIDRKTVRIPNTLLGLADLPGICKGLRASFHLVEPQSTVSGKRLHRMKTWIIKRFLTHLPGYGFIVLRTEKPALETAVKQLGRCVVKFQKRMRRELQREMNRKCNELAKALLPAINRNPPEDWTVFGFDVEDFPGLLHDELTEAFGTASELIRQMEVRLVFKAVTYESLNDSRFCALVQRRMPDLKVLHEEYVAARGVPPLTNDNAQDENLFKGAA